MQSLSLFYSRILDRLAVGTALYENASYTNKNNLPFLITAEPFKLSAKERETLIELGLALKELLTVAKTHYKQDFEPFFFRPDILLTTAGFKVCEIETQPFGFGLIIFLVKSYSFFTATLGQKAKEILLNFNHDWLEKTGSKSGIFVYTDHTLKFKGQLAYLVKLLNFYGGQFELKNVNDLSTTEIKTANFYRAFYTYEKDHNETMAKFLALEPKIFPKIAPYFEGKYLLADYFSDQTLRQKLSTSSLKILDQFILPTWRVDQAVPESFPLPIKAWEELSDLPKGQRNFVLKLAGNHPDSSWARSVIFLHKKSKVQLKEIFAKINQSHETWLIQQFFDYKEIEINYANDNFSQLLTMNNGRVRLTPYYKYPTGELLAAKATVRKDTLLIHAASDSVNTVVS